MHYILGLKDDCDKLCAEADIFVAKSIERENVGDIPMAALLSDTAAGMYFFVYKLLTNLVYLIWLSFSV